MCREERERQSEEVCTVKQRERPAAESAYTPGERERGMQKRGGDMLQQVKENGAKGTWRCMQCVRKREVPGEREEEKSK